MTVPVWIELTKFVLWSESGALETLSKYIATSSKIRALGIPR
jgi:hypothetical protein